LTDTLDERQINLGEVFDEKGKKFTAKFKREAMSLTETLGKLPVDLAPELGIRRNQRCKWKDQLAKRGRKALLRAGRGGRQKDEVTRLREESEKVKERVTF
jgi:transposase-like protein